MRLILVSNDFCIHFIEITYKKYHFMIVGVGADCGGFVGHCSSGRSSPKTQ